MDCLCFCYLDEWGDWCEPVLPTAQGFYGPRPCLYCKLAESVPKLQEQFSLIFSPYAIQTHLVHSLPLFLCTVWWWEGLHPVVWFISIIQLDIILEKNRPQWKEVTVPSSAVRDCEEGEAGNFPVCTLTPWSSYTYICLLPLSFPCAKVHPCWFVLLRHWCAIRALRLLLGLQNLNRNPSPEHLVTLYSPQQSDI